MKDRMIYNVLQLSRIGLEKMSPRKARTPSGLSRGNGSVMPISEMPLSFMPSSSMVCFFVGGTYARCRAGSKTVSFEVLGSVDDDDG